MSFSQEMKDLIAAYQTGQKINASRTDQDYKEALTDAQTKKTARDNDPAKLKLEDDQARATLEGTRARNALTGEQMKNQGVNRAYTNELIQTMRDRRLAPPATNVDPSLGAAYGATGLPGSPYAGPVAPGTGGMPAPTIQTEDDTLGYAEGGAIPDDVREEGTRRLGSAMRRNNETRSKLWGGDDQERGMSRAARTADDLEADRKGVSRERNGRIFYAAGGAIPDPDNDAASEPDNDGDESPAVGTSTTTDISARRRSPPTAGLDGVVSPQLVHDAVRGGYKSIISSAGLNGGVRSPRHQQAAQAVAQGVGGLSNDEMNMMRRAVDPEGKMTDMQRNMAAIGTAYQFYVNRGEPERAEKIAGQMLQHFRLASQRYAAIAAHAAEQGNVDLATRAAMKAYANVPDGKDMSLTVDKDTGKISYHYTDENGKTISKGLVTPQQLASSAMGLARGGFDQAILSAAGQREQAQGKGAATGKGTSAGNAKGALDATRAIGGDLGPEIEKLQANPNMKNVKPEYWEGLQNAATHIMQQNPDMRPNEALGAAQALLDPKNDQFKTVSQDGRNVVKFPDGQSVTMDDRAFDAVVGQRAAARKVQLQTEDQAAVDKAASDKRWNNVKEGAAQAGNAVYGIAKSADDVLATPGRAVKAAIPDSVKEEFKARAGSAVEKGKEALGDLGRRVADPDNLPLVGSYKAIRDADYPAIAGAIQTGVQSALEALRRGSSNPGAIPSNPDEQVPSAPPI